MYPLMSLLMYLKNLRYFLYVSFVRLSCVRFATSCTPASWLLRTAVAGTVSTFFLLSFFSSVLRPFLFALKKKELRKYDKQPETVFGDLARYYFRRSLFCLLRVCPERLSAYLAYSFLACSFRTRKYIAQSHLLDRAPFLAPFAQNCQGKFEEPDSGHIEGQG